MRSNWTSESLYVGDGRALTRVKDGHLMYVPVRDMSVGPWIVLEGEWDPVTSKVFLDAIKPGATVVDIGANIGWFTLLAARAVGPKGRVVAFEPDPQIADMLADNVELNGYLERVTIVRAAAAEAPGRATFHGAMKHRGNGSLVPNLNQLGDASAEIRTFDVELTTLDAQNLDRVDVMKVDAEGSEARVFRGATQTIKRSKHMTAIVEFWPRFFRTAGEDPKTFIDERKAEGFRIEQILREKAQVKKVRRVEEILERGVYELVFRK